MEWSTLCGEKTGWMHLRFFQAVHAHCVRKTIPVGICAMSWREVCELGLLVHPLLLGCFDELGDPRHLWVWMTYILLPLFCMA
jgi:hypothetical protein